MSVVTLTLRAPLEEQLDLEGVVPENLAGVSQLGIASLPITLGGRACALGDVFSIAGERSDQLRIEGDLSRAVRVGAGMSSGRIDVIGHVGDDAGLAMAGGVLVVDGNAGHRFCAAPPGASKGMTGGEAIVRGSARAEVAARCRRGLIVVGGDTGRDAARDIIAGTLAVFGRVGPEPGRRSKRGSIVALDGIDIPSTYRYACSFQPVFIRLLLTYLRRTYALRITDEMVDAAYKRYCGDAGEPGKGEILERIPSA